MNTMTTNDMATQTPPEPAEAEAELYRLVYVSRNRIPGTPAEVLAQVESILAASRRANAAMNITGALIFNSGTFAQVLEGARRDIEALIERILRDERHGEVQVLAFEPAPSRAFPNWSMGFIGRSREDDNLFAHVGAVTGFEAGRLGSDRLLELMRTIAIEDERRTP
ncbi:hypothetical protein BV133_986 [Blastochloris viridis]|nr:hypothetical protein BV133_986 [Blastochloris viridis]